MNKRSMKGLSKKLNPEEHPDIGQVLVGGFSMIAMAIIVGSLLLLLFINLFGHLL